MSTAGGAPTSTVDLGELILGLKDKSIYQGGLKSKDRVILWSDVKTLHIEWEKTSVEGIPSSENMTLYVNKFDKKNRFVFKLGAIFRMKEKSRNNFITIYEFIVSKIIDRQYNELMDNLNSGRRTDFKLFEITPAGIEQKKLFGGYVVVEPSRIVQYGIDRGTFYIRYEDNNKRIRLKNFGLISLIPNLHVAQAYLNSVIQQNRARKAQ